MPVYRALTMIGKDVADTGRKAPRRSDATAAGRIALAQRSRGPKAATETGNVLEG